MSCTSCGKGAKTGANEMSDMARVLLAMDASPMERELFRAMPALFGATELHVTGLLIDDEDVLRAASLPDATEVSLTGGIRRLTPTRLANDFGMRAADVRASLASTGDEMGFSTRFKIVHGRHTAMLQHEAQAFEFVIVTRSERPAALRAHGGRQLQPIVDMSKTILLVNEPWASGRSVVVAYENASSANAVRVATNYAREVGLELVVLVPQGRDVPEDVRSHGARRISVAWDEAALAHACNALDARLLVLSATDSTRWTKVVAALIDRLPCSILRLA